MIQANQLYHIYNQGNNKEIIFFSEENYLTFLQKLREFVLPYCDVLAYCLMPNHFHFLVSTDELSVEQIKVGSLTLTRLSDGFRRLLSGYASLVNQQQKRTGALFRPKIKTKRIESTQENYAAICFQYIHQNPLKAKLAAKMEEWKFSSFCDYFSNYTDTICAVSLAKEILNVDFDNFYESFASSNYRRFVVEYF